jgi:aldehyde dehydrogenase (NAD+)
MTRPALCPETRLYIDGKLRPAKSGRQYDNINPATAQVIGQAADAGPDDMEEAIAAARRAFDESDWSTNKELRLKVLKQFATGLRELAPQLREQVVAEVGAPMGITENGPQCDVPIGYFDYYHDILQNYQFEQDIGVAQSMSGPSRRLIWKEAMGVVGAISPWNFPVQINIAKIAPALAAGCSVVLKSAPDTPWTATILGKVAAEYTDIPPGVLNIITSSDVAGIGEQLVRDPRVDMISFTGSTATGRRIMAVASETVKKLFLELGGKSAAIILDDADFNSALLVGFAVCFHAGQGCAIPTRILLPRSRYEEGVAILKNYLSMMTPGDQYKPGQLIGAIVNRKQQDRILGLIETAKKEGARLVLGGGKPAGLPGYFIEPTLFADVTPDMTIAQQEVFGPVLVAIPYEDDEDAIRIANNSIYGLSGAVQSASLERALAVARRIRTGTMNINGANFYAADAPFGGYKQSGFGREMGVMGFEEYLQTKTVAIPA